MAAVLSLALLIGLGPLLDRAGLQGTATADALTGPHMIASAADIARLPRSGAAWRSLKKAADSRAGVPDLSNQDSNNDVLVLAKALVYAKTKIAHYRSSVLTNLRAVVGTETGGRTLAVGRGLPAYVIAADLISLPSFSPRFNTRTFRPWLKRLLTRNLDGDTLISTHNTRPNNWGTHAGAARIAIDIYLGAAGRLDLKKAARVFKGFLGDRRSYAGFNYGDDLSWQCSPSRPVGINPVCVKGGINVGGAIPDEMRRGASLRWPPVPTSYPWELMQGTVLQAELLQRAGYPAWTWQNKALLRAARFLYRAGWPADSNDDWQPWLLDYRYGTTFRTSGASHFGKNFGWTDWLYLKRVKGLPRTPTI
ncbi:MAG: alginate lyase family protein [Candidatus Limnocylindrales bacterium]